MERGHGVNEYKNPQTGNFPNEKRAERRHCTPGVPLITHCSLFGGHGDRNKHEFESLKVLRSKLAVDVDRRVSLDSQHFKYVTRPAKDRCEIVNK
jgi:hypothetical protein